MDFGNPGWFCLGNLAFYPKALSPFLIQPYDEPGSSLRIEHLEGSLCFDIDRSLSPRFHPSPLLGSAFAGAAMNYHFPFLPLNHAITVRRVGIALLFFAHAVVRLLNGTIPRFGEFLGQRGFPFGEAWIWGITVFELVGGILLIVGYQTRGHGSWLFQHRAWGYGADSSQIWMVCGRAMHRGLRI
jgi:hypothetical protein